MVRDRAPDTLRRSRLRLWAPVGGAFAITLLMALTPIASAAHPNTTLLAPFVGTHSASTKNGDATCGTAAGAGGMWKPASGSFTEAAKAVAHSCPYVSGFPYTFSERSDSVSFPISLPFQGEYNSSIGFNWKIVPTMNLTLGSCPISLNVSTGYDSYECGWDTYWDAEITLQMYDQTNGTYVGASFGYWVFQNFTETVDYNYCQSGTCGFNNNTYTGSSAYDYKSDSPSGGGTDLYLPDGLSTGTGSLWSNSTSWDAKHGTGTNHTLLLSDSYVIVATFAFDASAQLWGDHYYSAGTNSVTQPFNPAGSASSVISASGTGHGVKVISIAYSLV